VTVERHTDNTDNAAKNQTLSEKRAEAVRDFLVSAGVPADRITAVGKGDTQPVATNKTAAGRQQNRRVELVIAQ
jgi:OmpA-OmpF porin, OOP family